MMTKKAATKAFLAGYFSKVAQEVKYDPPLVPTPHVSPGGRTDTPFNMRAMYRYTGQEGTPIPFNRILSEREFRTDPNRIIERARKRNSGPPMLMTR